MESEFERDLKKQSQFAPARMGITSFVKGAYENRPRCPESLFEKTKPICRLLAGNPTRQMRNPKQTEGTREK
jgi:hypothetical protein